MPVSNSVFIMADQANRDAAELAEVLRRLEAKIDAAVSTEARRTFTFDEAAEQVLGISVQTLNRLVACGAVRPVTIGSRRFISRREIDRIEKEGAPFKEKQPSRTRTPRKNQAVLSEAEKVLSALKAKN